MAEATPEPTPTVINRGGGRRMLDQEVIEAGQAFDQSLMTANKKVMLDDEIDLARRTKQNAEGHDQDLAAFGLQVARDNHGLVQRIANNHAANDLRLTTNAATLDSLAGLNTVNAGQAIQAQIAQESAEAATAAANAAIAASTTTSAPAQGVTGVAQGGIQAGQAVATDAIMANIASNVNELSRLVAQNTKDIAQSNALMLQALADLGKTSAG